MHSIPSEISNVIVVLVRRTSELPHRFALLEGSHTIADTDTLVCTLCLLAHGHVEISFLSHSTVQSIHP